MQVEVIINGGVSLLLSPESPMEEEIIKGLMKQENSIVEFRTAVTILNKTFRNGIVIGKKSNASLDKRIEGEKVSNSDDKKS